ncbi:hypothetical protein D3C81_1917240 [compost metagenome]
MYITDNDGKNYITQFGDRNTFDLDRYDETKKETLINKIGSDNWYNVPPSVMPLDSISRGFILRFPLSFTQKIHQF